MAFKNGHKRQTQSCFMSPRVTDKEESHLEQGTAQGKPCAKGKWRFP